MSLAKCRRHGSGWCEAMRDGGGGDGSTCAVMRWSKAASPPWYHLGEHRVTTSVLMKGIVTRHSSYLSAGLDSACGRILADKVVLRWIALVLCWRGRGWRRGKV